MDCEATAKGTHTNMKVLIVPNYSREDATEGAQNVAEWLEAEDVEVAWAYNKERAPLGEHNAADSDLVVSFGGDGTLLRAARLIRYAGTPLLGISYGHLGFLTGADAHNVQQTISRAMAGELHSDNRTTLSVDVIFQDEAGKTREVKDVFCLNEMALSRGSMGDIVEFDIHVSGNFIDNLRADGFVVSTATGSTGYALSAGGPIVTPDFRGMVCVPIAPHTIQARAFLPSASDIVELTVLKERPVDRLVFCDGRLILPKDLGDLGDAGNSGDLVDPIDSVDSTAEAIFGQNQKSKWLPQKVTVSRGKEDIHLLADDNHAFYRSVSRVFYGFNDFPNTTNSSLRPRKTRGATAGTPSKETKDEPDETPEQDGLC